MYLSTILFEKVIGVGRLSQNYLNFRKSCGLTKQGVAETETNNIRKVRRDKLKEMKKTLYF